MTNKQKLEQRLVDVLALDTSAVLVMSLDASAKVRHRSRSTILNVFFGPLFGNMCVKHLSNL